MKKWVLKALVQKAISLMPFSQQLNFFFQKYVTKGVLLSDQYFEDRLHHCRMHYEAFRRYSKVEGFAHLEIGTGWYPVVPTGMFLYGAGSVTTVDLNRHSNELYTHQTLKKFADYQQKGILKNFLPGILDERIEVLLAESRNPSFDYYATLEKHNIVYQVMDARKLYLPDSSIDLFTSNNTFEHIYPEVLEGILDRLKQLARSGAVMSHSIDMSDHFAHLDPSITIYNFLKYSESTWKWINNNVQPQNRLRIYDYRRIFEKAGIPITEEINREFDLEIFKKMELADPFKGHPDELNAVSHSQLVSVINKPEVN